MKKMPLPVQVIGDTIFFVPHLIQAPVTWMRKLQILIDYCRLTLKLFLFAPFVRINNERFLSFSCHLLDYRTFHLVYRSVFIRGDYFFSARTAAPLILDCGANIGMATFYFKWLYPNSRIHAFEPDPVTFQILQRNIANNGLGDVICHPVAISNTEGNAFHYVDHDRPGYI